jgi:hypothetical protein
MKSSRAWHAVLVVVVVLMFGTTACQESLVRAEEEGTIDQTQTPPPPLLAEDPSSFQTSLNQTGLSAIPFLLTRLASNWLNATYLNMAEYYAGPSAAQNETGAVVSFIGKMASSAFEEIVQPGADLCLSS